MYIAKIDLNGTRNKNPIQCKYSSVNCLTHRILFNYSVVRNFNLTIYHIYQTEHVGALAMVSKLLERRRGGERQTDGKIHTDSKNRHYPTNSSPIASDIYVSRTSLNCDWACYWELPDWNVATILYCLIYPMSAALFFICISTTFKIQPKVVFRMLPISIDCWLKNFSACHFSGCQCLPREQWRMDGSICITPDGLGMFKHVLLGPLLLTWFNFNPSMDK